MERLYFLGKVIVLITIFFVLWFFNTVSASTWLTLRDWLVWEFLFEWNLVNWVDNSNNASWYVSYLTGATWSGSSWYISQNGSYPSYISFPSIMPLWDSSRTFSFWGKFDPSDFDAWRKNWRKIFSYWSQSGVWKFQFNASYDYNTYYNFDFGSEKLYTRIWVPLWQWVHHVIVYDTNSSELKLFINGDLKYSKILSYDLATYMKEYPMHIAEWTIMWIDDFLIYNRALSDFEVKWLTNIAPSISNLWSEDNYINPINLINKTLTIEWINDENYNELTFEYSFDNENFESLSWSLNTPIENWEFIFSFNGESLPDWSNIVYVRTFDGYEYSNIASIELEKNTIIPEINISKTIIDTNIQSQKYSLYYSTWTAYYSIISDWLCDWSKNFNDYEEVLLDVWSYNNKYICYKIDLWQWNIHYKSELISGIKWKMDYGRWDVFSSYLDWKKSTSAKQNDTTLAFLKMMVTSSTQWVTYSTVYNYPSSLVDVNWDGLVDMLYSHYYKINHDSEYKYAIMVNNGNYTFTPVYRCYIKGWYYYGDCAE